MADDDLLKLADLLDEAFDLGEDGRTPWLAELHRTQPKVAVRLEALLQRKDELKTDHLLVDGGRSVTPEALADVMEANRKREVTNTTPHGFVLQADAQVGPYLLIKPLGEGGMASVWLAERSDGQLKREVALKLLHAWRNSRDLVERFARERDMLASLVHPNIARLYDAGITESGQPWIALEYVEGVDLATYADTHRLTIRARIDAMQQVMRAVQHAHQNLIVHRDLKPTNILVNQSGDVRLLDFGIAKLLQAGHISAAETELTKDSGRALTLRYAAPEQIKGEPVTTATDVYALGLVLYELLTGTSPRTGTKTKVISEQAALSTDVLRPSRGALTEELSHRRGDVSTRELKSELSGDLDTILLKALARDPARRYRTVDALADDLRAWTEHRPIAARAPSFTYQIKMLLVRQRVPVAVGCVMFVALGALGAFAWKQHLYANQQSARAAQVQTFMANLLSEAEPDGVEDEKTLTAKSLLDAGVERARVVYRTQPIVQGEMLTELAHVYLRLGESKLGENLLKEAIDLIEKNSSESEPSLQIARAHLGARLTTKRDWQNSSALLNKVFAGCGSTEALCATARGIAHLSLARHPAINVEQKREHLRTSRQLFDQPVATPSQNEFKFEALILSAELERAEGDIALAKSLMSEAENHFAGTRQKLSERVLLAMLQSGVAFDSGNFLQAATIVDQTIAILEGTKKETSKLHLHMSRAHYANYQGLTSTALMHSGAARKISATQGPTINLAYVLRYEARALAMEGQYERAARTVDEAFDILRKKNVAENEEPWLDIARVAGELRARRGDLAGARAQLQAMQIVLRANHPKLFKDQANTLDLIGAISLAMNDPSTALTNHLEEVELLKAHLPQDHPLRLRAELQVALAKHAIEGKPDQPPEILSLAQKLEKFVPADSVHAKTLSTLISSDRSSSNGSQQPLVLIF
jgi:eukaryotic-like serine/threonine-protein kinase